MIHSLLLINKAGGLIFHKDFTSNLTKLTSNEALVLAGTLHGYVVASIRRARKYADVSIHSIHALTAQISPVPNSSGMEVLECQNFKIFCHQTLTGIHYQALSSNDDNYIGRYSNYSKTFKKGLKIILIADVIHISLEAPVKRIYELYGDFAMKNPFFTPDMPIRAELFDLAIQRLIRQINAMS
jgi:hypothetical protein